jgi:hypothetical protein
LAIVARFALRPRSPDRRGDPRPERTDAVVAVDDDDPVESFRTHNPSGAILARINDDSEANFDSRVILDDLDGLVGAGVAVPSDATMPSSMPFEAMGSRG